MTWITIIGLVLTLIEKLPAIIETLKKIFGTLQRGVLTRPLKVAREAAKVQAALEAKLAQVTFAEKHGLVPGALGELPCPLQALSVELEQTYARS